MARVCANTFIRHDDFIYRVQLKRKTSNCVIVGFITRKQSGLYLCVLIWVFYLKVGEEFPLKKR